MSSDPSVGEENQDSVKCPYCDSDDTNRIHPCGPSLCRSMYHCNSCEEDFEAFVDSGFRL